MLTVYADIRKDPITIIGYVARQRRFPRHFVAPRDLRCFSKSQDKSWNTRSMWAQIFRGINEIIQLQHIHLVNVLDNCSAHLIDYNKYDSMVPVLLLTRMTIVLQPFDASNGRSFKCVFFHQLVEHILEYIENILSQKVERQRPSKIMESETLFVAIQLMQKACHDFPTSVVFKGWLKADILAPHQNKKIRDFIIEVGRKVKPAEKSFEQSCFESDLLINQALAELAENKSNKCLENFISDLLD